ncbi:MAG: response regulator [Lachnospiraceae bacterium]|nr:response regulator [Lachnospiraceae bacterium]
MQLSKAEAKRDRIHCYLTWGVFTFFSLFMLATSIVGNWDNWVNLYVLFVIAFVSFFTWNKRVTVKVQSYIFVLMSMLNIMIYSVMEHNFYAAVVVICSLAALTAIYMDAKLIFLLSLLSVGAVIIHVGVLHTIQVVTLHDKIALGIRVIAMFAAEIFLTYFVNRQYWIEESLKANVEEARKADRSKAEFLANMSHEIRTPMNAIVGMCELILRENINDEVKENCINIQHSGRSLLAIINDILDFSKLNSGKAELVEEPFNIGSMVNDVMNMAITRKGGKNIEIIARVDPEIPKGLIGDEVRIRQVIINLITNAIKFTEKGCVVLKITQSRHEYGINLNVSVADTGIGITEENLEKLFTSFQQVDTRKNRSVEGTGLGLAICKNLVARMGGFMNVSSVYGEGSTFHFVIPLKVSDEEAFITIQNAESSSVAIYVEMKKFQYMRVVKEYMKLIRELSDKFGTEIQLFEDAETFRTEWKKKRYTHCFTAKDEYLCHKELFGEIAEQSKVFVIQERSNAVPLSGGIKCIYKPFYAMSVAAALNNEKYILNLGERKSVARFVAPEARVLIVDDNVTNLKVAEGLMRPYNMKISTAISGREALDMLRKKDYDIVFMDHMMPELDGVETTALIREMDGEYYKKLPVVALTANAVNGAREMFLSSGFNDFIAKPIELSFLDRVLRAWLPKEKVQSVLVLQQVPENDTETVLLESFREVIQEEKGLVYAGESRETYYDNLNTYLKNGEMYRRSLQRRYEEEDWSNYIIEVHAIKSSSLSIGAVKLSELAKTLEFAGKEGNFDVIRAKQQALIGLYDRVLDEIKKYLSINGRMEDSEKDNERKNAPLTELPESKLVTYVEQICSACDNFDGEGVVVIVNLLEEYSFRGKVLREYFGPVKQLAEDFEYENALHAAKECIAKLREETV